MSLSISLTENAGKRIAHLATLEEQPGAHLRIKVTGGGCSGLQYNYIFPDYVTDPEKDEVLSIKGGTAVIDKKSLEFMKHSVIDYVDTIAYSGFEIKNPDAKASCGCGNSFDV